jgi:hypothetical protein
VVNRCSGAHPLSQQALERFDVGKAADAHRGSREARFVEHGFNAECPQPEPEVVILASTHLDVSSIRAFRSQEAEFDAAVDQIVRRLDRSRHGPRHALPHQKGHRPLEQAGFEELAGGRSG